MGLSIFDYPREPYTIQKYCPKCGKIRPFIATPVFGVYGAVSNTIYKCQHCKREFEKIVKSELIEIKREHKKR